MVVAFTLVRELKSRIVSPFDSHLRGSCTNNTTAGILIPVGHLLGSFSLSVSSVLYNGLADQVAAAQQSGWYHSNFLFKWKFIASSKVLPNHTCYNKSNSYLNNGRSIDLLVTIVRDPQETLKRRNGSVLRRINKGKFNSSLLLIMVQISGL